MRRLIIFTLLGASLVFIGLTQWSIINEKLFPDSDAAVIAGLEERGTFIDQLTYLQNVRRAEPLIPSMSRVKALNKLITKLMVTGQFNGRQHPVDYKTMTESDQYKILNVMAESYWYQVQEHDYLDAMKTVPENKPYFDFLKEALLYTKVLNVSLGEHVMPAKMRQEKNSEKFKFTPQIWKLNFEGDSTGLTFFENSYGGYRLEKPLAKIWIEIFSHPEFAELYEESLEAFAKRLAPEGVQIPIIFNPIESYAGNKLLLFGGRDYPEAGTEKYREESKDWYTVDMDPVMQPDLLADIRSKETLAYMQRKQFSLVVNEYGNAFREAAEMAFNLLQKGGVYFANVPGPNFWIYDFKSAEDVKQWMESQGFSKVIFFLEPEHPYIPGSYWFKHYDAAGLIKIAEERKSLPYDAPKDTVVLVAIK